jgi:hypothetical protein
MHVVICGFYFILVKRAAFETWEAGGLGRFGEDRETVKSRNWKTAKAMESMSRGHLPCGLRSHGGAPKATCHTHSCSLLCILKSMSDSIKSNQLQRSDAAQACIYPGTPQLQRQQTGPFVTICEDGVHQTRAFCKQIKK